MTHFPGGMNHPSSGSINSPGKRAVFPEKSGMLTEDQYVSIEDPSGSPGK
jgi:hypothetical protein